jgi:hypothetical protein
MLWRSVLTLARHHAMPEGEQDTWDAFYENTKGVSRVITAVRKNSMDIEDRDIPAPLSLVFIDGDHSYKGVKSDFERCSRWFADRVIVTFHDGTSHEGVSRVIGDMLVSSQWALVGICESLCWLKKITFTK